MGSNEVQILRYCTQVDFSDIFTLLYYLFFWRLFTSTPYIFTQISLLSTPYILKNCIVTLVLNHFNGVTVIIFHAINTKFNLIGWESTLHLKHHYKMNRQIRRYSFAANHCSLVAVALA